MKLKMKMKLKRRKANSGQAILEYMILLFVVMSSWAIVSKLLKSSDYLNTIFTTPWQRLANTIEFGIPTNDKKTAAAGHPTAVARHTSHTEVQ